jgi:hypothetical protein
VDEQERIAQTASRYDVGGQLGRDRARPTLATTTSRPLRA